jgi:preprotein translocase subunit YajC
MISTVWAAEAAPSMGANADALGMLLGYAPIILIFVVFYFLLIRPQNQAAKEHMNVLAALKNGDVVLLDGGQFAEVKALEPTVLTVSVDRLHKQLVLRTAVRRLADAAEQKAWHEATRHAQDAAVKTKK